MRSLNLRVDERTSERLQRLADLTGRSKSFYATDAIRQYLDDHEDYFLAKDALDEFTQSNDAAVLHEDVDWDALGK